MHRDGGDVRGRQDAAGRRRAGTYAGGTASATVGVGVGANGLIGGSFSSIALQPLDQSWVQRVGRLASLTLGAWDNDARRERPLSGQKRKQPVRDVGFCSAPIVLKNSKIGPGEETRQIEIRR